jgi:hypothetical protein
MSNQEEIEKAKALLKANGYQVDNLWTVDDVRGKFNCTDEQAQEIMTKALTNEATMEQIWFALDFHGEDAGLERVDND